MWEKKRERGRETDTVAAQGDNSGSIGSLLWQSPGMLSRCCVSFFPFISFLHFNSCGFCFVAVRNTCFNLWRAFTHFLSSQAFMAYRLVHSRAVLMASASLTFHCSATSLARGSSGLGALRRAWMESSTVRIWRAGLHLSGGYQKQRNHTMSFC